jgi:hypothetical protein
MTVFRIRFIKISFFFRAVIIVAVVDDSLDYLFCPCRIKYPCALAIELYILSIYLSIYLSIHGFGSHDSHSQSILLIPTAFQCSLRFSIHCWYLLFICAIGRVNSGSRNRQVKIDWVPHDSLVNSMRLTPKQCECSSNPVLSRLAFIHRGRTW